MSFVLWYKVEIVEAGVPAGLGLPVTVSNDPLVGSWIADADITVTMTDGAAAATFEVGIVNLPGAITELIKNTHAARPVNAIIHLGYFDEPSTRTGGGQVLVGRIMSVTGSVGADGFSRTVLCGQDEAGYLLRCTPAELDRAAAGTTLELAGALALAAGVQVSDGSTLPGTAEGVTVRAGSTLDALGALAARSDVPLVIRDGKVFLGAAVGAPTDPAPVVFDPDTNLAALSSSTSEDTAARPPFQQDRMPVRATMDITAIGHPGLRVGQVAFTAGLSDVPPGPFRLAHVVHNFRLEAGYTTELRLISAGPGERAQVNTGAQGLVDRLRDLVDRGRDDHPAVDVGDVPAAADGLASLRYGAAGELHEQPVASPFAFHRTGLVTPVYPKMRALLAHNGGAVDDAVVAGFLWPDGDAQTDGAQRPAAETGDYWLALPTGLGADGLPQGKGANDLTDAAGRRVIQVAALHVLVGADALPDVGTRPAPPADDEIVIEHHTGTTITVGADGGVTISTAHKPITLTTGKVSMTLDDSAVSVQ